MIREITLRDPLWDTIRIDSVAVRIVDSAAFQRLRHIKQLGLAHLVYPGATHTRFDHAIGVYHLACKALEGMRARNALRNVPADDARIAPFAALLHDIGHYPFSHAVEELEEGRIPGHHEALVGRFLADAAVASAIETLAPNARSAIEQLIRGASASPLQGLVSGSLDLDKIEYLRRDAHFCGVPYGDVDVDRLLFALEVLQDPATGTSEIGVHEKGVAALESLLFAKYQMFRNVYWHHAVRAATVMYKRIIDDALTAALISPEELVGQTDEGVLFLIESRASAHGAAVIAERIARLRTRTLPKRAVEVPAGELEEPAAGWLSSDTELKRRVEEQLARELALPPGGVFLDYPEKNAMFALNLLVQRRSGEIIRVGPSGRSGLIGLPAVSEELYRTARVLRVFTLPERRPVDSRRLIRLVSAGADAAQERLDRGAALLE